MSAATTPRDDWHAEPQDTPFDTRDWHRVPAELYRHWRSLRPAPDRLPGRRHFDPLDVPNLLPSIWLLDLQREPLRLKYRLVGTNLVDMLGTDPTGKWLDDARPAISGDDSYLDRYRWMIGSCRATWRHGPPRLSLDARWGTVENIILPLAADGAKVDMFLCASIHFGHDGRVL